ncbi:alpha/beta fold hydrolase [Roseovarius salis]|uniref:alpha/beta fold hydrolase n=1 Tax=Roseovarius salis TaxID=3376063 RepID=UPI0037C6E93F
MLSPAPLFNDMAEGPPGGQAWWVTAPDGMRLRIGLWQPGQAAGTVLLFPGRTEYVEKYGRTAQDLARHGLATLVIDWRGQGLADRLAEDPMAGHVLRFRDYQHDVAAMIAAARELHAPGPWYLLAHSMGGCIGLRAAMEGLPVTSCVFSGPMWGIRMADALRPVAWSLSWSGKQLGIGHLYAPGTAPGHYVLEEPFETNKLTTDRDMYDYMIGHLRAHPELGLGGPSLRWLHEALADARALARRPAPELRCLTLVGSQEDIVDADRIKARMQQWPGGHLQVVPGGRHEVLMENAATRAHLFETISAFYRQSHAACAQDHGDRGAPGTTVRV